MIRSLADDDTSLRKQHDSSPDVNSSSESRSPIIWWICLAGMAFVLLNAARSIPQISDLLMDADGDDQMRLVQVRDWLAGQSWFDTRQYRVLPPEGISMHWSRYVDAGIAAVLVAASSVLPTTQAELATVILWPSLLACLMVLVIAHGTDRLMGKAAAVGALAAFLTWGKLGGEFVPPRIDHHSVQLLLGTAVFYLSLIPGRARLLGAVAGTLTALSLAVGLEMLPFLALIWGMVALRHAFAHPQTGDWLLGFGVAITLAAPLLMAGQTPAAAWGILHCDVLAPPALALGAIGVTATLVPVLAAQFMQGPVARILAMLTITALGLWLAFPLLGACLAGPYSNVPPAVRDIIENNVIEALSAPFLLRHNPELLGRVLLPPIVIALLALATAWRLRARLSPLQVTALIQAFIVVAVGFVFAMVQIRAANLMAPAVPLLAGFLVHAFTLIPRSNPLRLPAITVLVLALPTVVERGATAAVLLHAPEVTSPVTPGQALPNETCRNAPAMAEIASLPTSVIFSPLNLGPTILASTPHSVTSAAYHRSPTAFWNGIGALRTRESLRDALSGTGADYLVLCSGGTLENSVPFLRALLDGQMPDWLTDTTADRRLVRVFRVNKNAPASTGGSP